MGKLKRRNPSADEQQVLVGLQIRVVTARKDIARFDKLIVEHHYLKDATLVGEHLRYVACHQGRWLALASWSAAALHLKDRDQFIGWDHSQCRRRLPLLANNSRLLVLPECHHPNLVSRFMRLMLARLSDDWRERWGHPLALAETFVDPQFHQGTAYKASGWSHLGKTAGWKRDAADFYTQHNAPKEIWVRELVRNACQKLRAPQLPAEWAAVEEQARPRCEHKAVEIRSLMESLRRELPEFRRAQALGYPVAGMAALIVMAMATGVRKGPDDLAQYADTLSQAQLRALGFRQDRRTRRHRAPKKTTFTRVLAGLDCGVLERLLLEWQRRLAGPGDDPLVIIDGKKMRHGGVEMVNAADGRGQFLGGVMTQEGSNEIPAARQLLERLELAGKLVVADAAHTQVETARQILFAQGGDYVMTVKANQKTLQSTLQTLFEKRGFSPSEPPLQPGVAAGAQPGPAGDPPSPMPGGDAPPGRLSGGPDGGPAGDPGQARGQVDPRGRLSGQQPEHRGVGGPGAAGVQTPLLGD
jgi:hypothetical protein